MIKSVSLVDFITEATPSQLQLTLVNKLTFSYYKIVYCKNLLLKMRYDENVNLVTKIDDGDVEKSTVNSSNKRTHLHK